MNYDVITRDHMICMHVWAGRAVVVGACKRARLAQFTTVTHACTMVERSFSHSNYGTISGQARGFTAKGEDYREKFNYW